MQGKCSVTDGISNGDAQQTFIGRGVCRLDTRRLVLCYFNLKICAKVQFPKTDYLTQSSVS
jgi:hypothetical protein